MCRCDRGSSRLTGFPRTEYVARFQRMALSRGNSFLRFFERCGKPRESLESCWSKDLSALWRYFVLIKNIVVKHFSTLFRNIGYHHRTCTLSCRGHRFRHKPLATSKSENRSQDIIERMITRFTILSRNVMARFDAKVSPAAILRGGRANLHGSPRGTGPIVGIMGGSRFADLSFDRRR